MAWIDGPLRHQRTGTTGTGSVLWLGMLGASHGRLGNFPAAIDAARKACLIADEVRRPYDIALAYWWAGFIQSHKGDVPAALQYLEHGFKVCRSSQVNFLVPVLSTTLGYTYALAGRTAEGIALLTKALGFSRASKFTYGEAWSSAYLGFAKLLDNDYEGMLDHARSVLELARKHKYRAIEVDALHLLGDVYRKGPAPAQDEAERHYLQAREMCLELGLRPELRALRDWSRANACAIGPPGGGRAALRFRFATLSRHGLGLAGRLSRPPSKSQFILNRIGRLLGPPMKIDAERRGLPASSIHSSRPSNSSKKIRISSRARCWPRQAWTP